MGGKAKQAQRQAYESRAANRGMGLVTVRLSPDAHRMLRAICTARECTPREVVEGLLLGHVSPAPEIPRGLSAPEVEEFLWQKEATR